MSITPRIDFSQALAGLFDLRGKTAYVPGGYGGIGEAIAWGLALAGAPVAVSGRRPGTGPQVAGVLKAAGTARPVPACGPHSWPPLPGLESAVEPAAGQHPAVGAGDHRCAREDADQLRTQHVQAAAGQDDVDQCPVNLLGSRKHRSLTVQHGAQHLVDHVGEPDAVGQGDER